MNWIINRRYLILGIFVLLFIGSVVLFFQVNINYDNTKYLPEDRPTKQAFIVLNNEFGNHGYAEVMVKDISAQDAEILKQQFSLISGIQMIDFSKASMDDYQNNHALFEITFQEDNYATKTKEAIDEMKRMLETQDYYLGGESVIAIRYSEVIQEEILKIIAILLPIILIILLFTTTSWIDPLLFLIIIAISVIINMGTNAFFPSISYMTHATCGILQIALCMDYSVIILHSYRKNLTLGNDEKTSVLKALKESFLPILGSASTTIISFVVIMFMRYQIGFDIGVVLAKGTFISLVVTLLIMPGLIIIFGKLIKKTEHKSFIKPKHWVVHFILRTKYILPLFAIALIGGAIYMQGKLQFAYGEMAIASESTVIAQNQNEINDVFGNRNQFLILIPKQEAEKESSIIASIQNYIALNDIKAKQITSISMFYYPYDRLSFQGFLTSFGLEADAIGSLMNIFDVISMQTGNVDLSIMDMRHFIETTDQLTIEQKEALIPFVVQINQVEQLLVSDHYHRIFIKVDLPVESEETFAFVDAIRTMQNNLFVEESYLIGESAAIFDMKEVVETDYKISTIITALLIFLVIMILFRSFSVPFFLVFLIEGAIFINMAVPALLNSNILYLGYIIISCIQLGATIDYGILFANRYLAYRKTNSAKQSIFFAFEETKNTVLTSGLILIGAGYVLGFASSIPSIAVFGTLIGRGAMISTLLVLFILPQVMLVFDKLIQKTTHKI